VCTKFHIASGQKIDTARSASKVEPGQGRPFRGEAHLDTVSSIGDNSEALAALVPP
jgi:hypothetical protein